MGKTIQIKRGPKNTMPTLAQGELGMTTDSGAEGLFIGTGTKNIEMARKSDLNISGQISTHNSNSSAHSDIRKSVTTHTGNTSIHVTAEEKNAWNAKLDSYTETDPTVPAWAKAKSKPSYTASEVGAVPTSRTVNGKALSSDITLSASDVGLGNVGNFKAVSTVASQSLTDTEKSNARANIGAGTSSLTIGTTASTAAAGNHTHTAANVGAVPTSRKVNGKALSSDITLSASDVGLGNVGNFKAVSTVASQDLTDTEKSNARSNIGAGTSSLTIGTTASTAAAGNHTHTAANVGAVPTSRKVNGKALSSDITLSASDVSARPSSWTPSASDVGAVPTSRKVNGKALSSDITLSASDVGLGNVGNFKAVSTVASQDLTDTEKSNARANIGAGTSSLTIGTTASTAAAGNHTHTAANVGAVPTSRKVNGKALSSDITLSASDVGARPGSWTPSASDVGLGNVGNFKAVSTVASQGLSDTEKSNARANIGAGTSSLTIGTTASTAAAGNHTHTAANVGAVPTSRKVNGKALSSDITLSASDVSARPSSWTPSASDVGAVPTSRKVNGKALSSDITLSASDVSAAPASHTSDSTVHVTSEEKSRWNAKADAPFKPAGTSYLTFSSPNSFTLKVNDTTKHWNGTLEYFASDRIWTTWDGTTTLSSVDNDGEHVLYLRGTGNTVITGDSSNYRWVLTGSAIACTGNIENLLDYATVESGNHPTMASYSYANMFRDCTSLTQAPALPATTLADYCYQAMFYGCTSLTQAPALPATTLAFRCYQNMFSHCYILTQAPDLPSENLEQGCYQGMFQDCTSLTKAPALHAMVLSDECYQGMFQGCTSLTQAPALPAQELANNCYQGMFQDCVNLKQAPALPATTLTYFCYGFMFYGCSSLTQIPSLPATTLANSCYYSMFDGCSSLKLSNTKTGEYIVEYRIPMSGDGTTTTNALRTMFMNTGGTFTGTPEINTTYYLSTDNIVVRKTEIDTLKGYVGSISAPSYGTEDLEAGTSPLETGKLYFVYE